MRILGYIEDPTYKITIFKNNMRFIVKVEDEFFEQSFKFRENDTLQTLEDVKLLIDPIFRKKVELQFQVMQDMAMDALERHLAYTEDEWDEEII